MTLFLWNNVERTVLVAKNTTMEPNNILKADVLDIIFENRNKAYGAYELRTTYNKRIKRSLMGMGAVCLVFTAGVLIANAKKNEITASIPIIEVSLSDVPETEKEKPVVVPPQAKPLEVRTIAVTIPRIVPDELVPETEVPSEDQIENVTISNVTNDKGVEGDFVAPPLEEGTGATLSVKKEEPDYTKEFVIVQQQAQYPGGLKEWSKFLERNLNTELPVENGAPVGQYTVVLSFIVDAEGNISEIQALNDPGYGTVQEAVKVIKRSKQWIPAVQNGRNVIYRQKQSITFIVNEG